MDLLVMVITLVRFIPDHVNTLEVDNLAEIAEFG